MFGWLTRRRRERIKRRRFPDEWMAILHRSFSHWAALTRDEQERLRGHIQVFLAEKNFVGCGELEISDEIRVTIAAQACLLLLNRRADYFPRMKSILVYPAGYVSPVRHAGPGGFVVETEQPRAGESWYRGPIVLSWDDVARGAADAADGHNVVLHEFAHQLDSEDGSVNGAPDLGAKDRYTAWSRVLGEEFQDLVERMHDHRGSTIRGYGATSPAEFFAVVTECFFEKPHELKQRHAELYEQFKSFYGQDPAGRTED